MQVLKFTVRSWYSTMPTRSKKYRKHLSNANWMREIQLRWVNFPVTFARQWGKNRAMFTMTSSLALRDQTSNSSRITTHRHISITNTFFPPFHEIENTFLFYLLVWDNRYHSPHKATWLELKRIWLSSNNLCQCQLIDVLTFLFSLLQNKAPSIEYTYIRQASI